ncbi:hypothetical protein LTR16_002256, partial [Cryomyces antarcticus]
MFLSFLLTPYALLAIPLVYYLLPYLRNWSIRDIPSPFPAAFTNLWLLYQCRRGRRYLAVDAVHKKYGKLVRIQPNHVSVADPDAIPIIYGHGNGFLKSDYYDAFVSIQRGLFNTRDRTEHTRKRKTVSHTFSTKSIGQFEQYMHHNLEELTSQWDRMASHAPGEKGKGYAEMDALHWFNYLAFDIIGDLAFGAPFGMLEKGKDIAEVRSSPDAPPTFAPAIEVLNRRGEVSGTLGCLPALKPYARYLPDSFFTQGVKAVENLAGIATARVKSRLDNPNTDRVDLLARLMEGRDENGNKLGRQELTAEALTQLIAGSDTTSNTSCALLYHCLNNPYVVEKLHKELDQALPNKDQVPQFDQVRDLPYLDCVIKETMRIHSTSSLGLPRVVPAGPGIDLCGHHFPQETVLSVPAYTIHHSKEIWGNDADEFRPERWENATEKQKAAFIPFSYGPRACVGRNVAEMEMALIVSTVFRRYILRRAALRTLSSPSTSFISKSRSLTTVTPWATRPKQQWATASLQKRFASNEASPTEAETTNETVTEEPSKAERDIINENAPSNLPSESTDNPNLTNFTDTPEPSSARHGKQGTVASAIESATETVKEKASEAAEAMSRGSQGMRESFGEAAGSAAAATGMRGSYSQGREREGFGQQSRPVPPPSKILYVGNLYFEVREDVLKREFQRFGNVANCRIVYDNRGLSKGFGYVEFDDLESATNAIQGLNSAVFEGRRLAVQYHMRREPRGATSEPRELREPSKTLFIGNMSFEMSDKDLNDLFREIRNVLDVRVAIDRRTGQPRGFAHADF